MLTDHSIGTVLWVNLHLLGTTVSDLHAFWCSSQVKYTAQALLTKASLKLVQSIEVTPVCPASWSHQRSKYSGKTPQGGSQLYTCCFHGVQHWQTFTQGVCGNPNKVAGEAWGRLVEVERIEPGALDEMNEPIVLLVKLASGDEEVRAAGVDLKGVILCHGLPHLSHLGKPGYPYLLLVSVYRTDFCGQNQG